MGQGDEGVAEEEGDEETRDAPYPPEAQEDYGNRRYVNALMFPEGEACRRRREELAAAPEQRLDARGSNRTPGRRPPTEHTIAQEDYATDIASRYDDAANGNQLRGRWSGDQNEGRLIQNKNSGVCGVEVSRRVVGRFCWAVLWGGSVGRFCGAVLSGGSVGRFCGAVLSGPAADATEPTVTR
ncbi:hypothetical protein EYF80_060106 [Liparis tanakae]|uniref:Uncharacterized protein n=1 Tax=Liparis tanakae TaxID=230148 RepID=A0A4Z2ELU9_9TELE|nr:hypothetical protein EYF80_060106 [Liparis tanakae]